MAGANLAYVTNEDYKTPDSNSWGVGGVPSEPVADYGQNVEAGVYDTRDDLVGGTDSMWNQADNRLSGACWASAEESAPVFNASSGLGGERTGFSKVLSAADLAGSWA